MQTGSRRAGTAARSGRARGFTYLGVLWLLALSSAGVAVVTESWTLAARRERERELVFRGEQIRAAIDRYRRAYPARSEWPRSLDDLLEDRRQEQVHHHLRRRFSDPFAPDSGWGEIREVGGGLIGVHSTASLPPLGRGPRDDDRTAPATRVSDWRFIVTGAIEADRPTPTQGNR